MASHLISEREPSLQSSRRERSHDPYLHLNNDPDDEDDLQNLKFSLAHYFSPIFVVFIGVLLTATIVLFIWSNTSDGAWVSLQVSPILPSDSSVSSGSETTNSWIPIILSFASNHTTNDESIIQSLSSFLLHDDSFNDYDLMINDTNNITAESVSIPDLDHLSLNKEICFVLSFTL